MPNMCLKPLSDRERLKEIKTLIAEWFDEPSYKYLLTDTASAYVILGTIKELVKDV